MAGDHRATANHNIEILNSIGYRKLGNTSIFTNGKYKLLSPAVSCGKGGDYWFDIRQVNVDKVQGDNSSILIRIIPNMFIRIKLSDFTPMLSEETMRIRKNSGAVWGFYTSLNINNGSAKIVSSANSSLSHSTKIVKKEDITALLNDSISA